MALGFPQLIADALLLAQENGGSSTGSGLSSLIFIGLIFVAFYFFLIRPQRKRAESVRSFQQSLEVGDEIRTAGGIIGVVTSISDTQVMVDVGGVTMTFVRGAIAGPAGDDQA